MDRQTRLGKEPVGKLLWQFSIPAIVGMLVTALYNIIDRIYIGNIPNVGSVAITGVGITLPIMTIIMAFGMLVGIGTSARVSLTLGEGKKDEAEKLLGNAFTLLIIIGIAISILGIVFGEKILFIFGASKNTIYYAKEYINIIFIGTIFNMISFGLNHSIRAEGNPKVAMFTMLIGALLNAILDPIFIFVFKLGVRGAAIATILSQLVCAIWILRYFLGKNSTLKIRKRNLKLQFNLMISIFSIGMSPFAMQLAASLVQVICNNALISYGGDIAVGAMTIIGSISSIFFMPIFGINQGGQPIIGYNYGSHKYNRVKKAVKDSALAATIIMIIGFLIIELCPQLVIRIFNNDEGLVSTATYGIRIYLCMIPFVGFQIISANYFQSIGKAKISMFLSLLRQIILLIPMLLILPKVFGITGVWLAGPVSDFISSVVTGILFYSDIKKLKEKEDKEEDIIMEVV
ncbi:MATE family efflux transporter [Clostridium fallax]|uniref:Multidrug export protein MepA n=1 Tax=Clostridium fallax TaxID=1533 RepID=A0A1M4T972_9CLOT|nr:MATE family efflux transporter [Clostridium fallax]SHE40960.1 putative efflux protein, MATE family [Clostridium fallax]SQB22656.1 MATE efflux family protein [Clostridium fallax]